MFIIFIFGLCSRIFVNYCFDLNVFTDYFHYISLLYYLLLSSFIVSIHYLFDLINIDLFSFKTLLVNFFRSLYAMFESKKLLMSGHPDPFSANVVDSKDKSFNITTLKCEDGDVDNPTIKPVNLKPVNPIPNRTRDTVNALVVDVNHNSNNHNRQLHNKEKYTNLRDLAKDSKGKGVSTSQSDAAFGNIVDSKSQSENPRAHMVSNTNSFDTLNFVLKSDGSDYAYISSVKNSNYPNSYTDLSISDTPDLTSKRLNIKSQVYSSTLSKTISGNKTNHVIVDSAKTSVFNKGTINEVNISPKAVLFDFPSSNNQNDLSLDVKQPIYDVNCKSKFSSDSSMVFPVNKESNMIISFFNTKLGSFKSIVLNYEDSVKRKII